jgi:hypothetical protein
MKIYNKSFLGCAVVVSSLLLMACDQAANNQSDNLTVPEVSAATVSKVGATVALSDDNISVYKGDVFTLDIMMDEFEPSEGGGVTLRFDAALVQVVNVTLDSSVWSFKNKDGFVNNAEGTVSDILFSSYQGVEGSAKVATVEFKSIEAGVSTITLEESAANVFASGGENVAVVFNTTTVSSN